MASATRGTRDAGNAARLFLARSTARAQPAYERLLAKAEYHTAELGSETRRDAWKFQGNMSVIVNLSKTYDEKYHQRAKKG